ncbi:hypothetical protein [Streptomyces sp. NPDC089919]|uniref:hypothetical protein n=1 Tax=Streptomyces sp. NPDC089919 TaxID=3155188 RepID=UPI00342752E2
MPRRVALCAPCHAGRPGRDDDVLLAVDFAWRTLHGDATALLQAYAEHQWIPSRAEGEFAGDLARTRWCEESMRAAVRGAGDEVLAGRLVGVLHPTAYVVLRDVAPADPSLHSLRCLIDTVASAAEDTIGALRLL